MQIDPMAGQSGPLAEMMQPTAEATELLEQAVEALQGGKLVAFPTDTVYGVGAHAFLPEAVMRLYAIKDRPSHMPIPLLLPDTAMVNALCTDIPPVVWPIVERFWPGGLSLVLRRASIVPDVVTANGPTVAVRVPDQPLVRDLCRRLGAPLAATSANRHGQPASVTAGEVQRVLGGCVSLVLDGGRCPGGMASTVLDMTVSPPTILRHGPVSAEELSELVPLST
jgi:L-threonylcarbamoyladenylate synthase